MARRSKRDSDELFLAALMSLPWWVSFVLAAILTVLAVLAFMFAYRTAAFGAFMWACILVSAGILLPFVKRRSDAVIMAAQDLPAIRQMSWQNFERLVGEAFRRQGYIVVERGGAKPDGGVDLVLHKGTEKIIVQCKHWQTKPVGVAPVRELRGVVAREKAKRGIFVTSNSYTEDALAEAKGQPLELIDGAELLKLVQGVQAEPVEPQRKPPEMQTAVPATIVENKVQTPDENDAPLCPICGSLMIRQLARRGASAGSEFWGCSTWSRSGCKGKRQI